MSFAYSIAFAAVLPYVSVGLAKAAGIDNRAPLPGVRTLRGGGHHLPLASVPASRIDVLAGLFIVARIAHTDAYIADRAMLRSLIWVVGVGCVVTLFISCGHGLADLSLAVPCAAKDDRVVRGTGRS